MKRCSLILFTTLLLTLLLGCRNTTRVEAQLDCLDSLVVENPDSVLSVLESMQEQMKGETEDLWMYYQLLLIKADFLIYECHGNDSIVHSVFHYYERHPNKYLKAQSYYYTGRTYEYYGDALQAIDYYQQVLDMLPENLEDRKSTFLRGCVFSHMGTLLYKQGMYEQALSCCQMVYKYDSLLHHKSLLVLDERDLGFTYYALHQKDSALYYYEKAEQTALSLGDTLSLKYAQLMRVEYYRDEGDYVKALELNSKLIPSVNSSIVENVYYLQGELYYRLNRIDSSKVYFQKVLSLPHASSISRGNANKVLGEISLKEDRLTDAVDFLNAYIHCSDTIDQMQRKEAVLKAHELYNYTLRERENQQLSLENERKTNLLITLLLIFLLSVTVSIAVYRHLKMKNAQSRLQIIRLRRWNAEQERSSQAYIDNNLLQIEALKLQLQSVESEKEQYKQSLQLQIAKLQSENQKAILGKEEKKRQWKEVLKSDTYRCLLSELKKGNIVRETMWQDVESMVNDVYEGFTEQLREYVSMNETETQVALLTKLQFSPAEIAVLVGRGRSSITMLRKRLYFKFFGIEGHSKDLDNYLLSL